MTSAKNDFIKRIRTLKKSISETEAVRSKAPSEIEHNEVARMLRNGLAVVGFASLEDFIKARCREVLQSIGNVGIKFEKLPEKIQIASTHGAIAALNYQLNFRSKEEKLSFVQEHALKISSTANDSYELTYLAFGFNQPNLNAESIKAILKCFNIEDPWKQITNIGSELGLVALPLEISFTNAALRRHRAAHVAEADTPQNDISEFVNEAIGIAIGFDFLLTKALNTIESRDDNYLKGNTTITSSAISYRVVKHAGGIWKEYVNKKTRAFRTNENINDLSEEAKSRAKKSHQFYIELDENNLIKDWAY